MENTLFIIRINQKGSTLFELRMVVAIICILAAIAIPQFTAHRQKGMNAAAQSEGIKKFNIAIK